MSEIADPNEETGLRKLSGWQASSVRALSISLSLYVALYISGGLDWLGIRLFGAHRALVLSGILVLVFMLFPAAAGAPRDKVPIYDWIFAIAGAGASLYAFTSWGKWVFGVNIPTFQEEVLAALLVLVTLEASRRTLGLAFTLIGILFLIYPLIGHTLPGILVTNNYSSTQLAQFFYLSGGTSGIFGIPLEIFTTTVAIFLLFGAFLTATGASDAFLDIAKAAAGRRRGGMAKVSLLSSALFATISGVGVANVMITGGFTIPAMKRMNYRPAFAAAVEATASTGGILMPPIMGAAAFLMADILAVSYWTIVLAALLPSVLYYLSIYIMVDAEGGRRSLSGLPAHEIPKILPTLGRAWFLLLAIVVLLVLIGPYGLPVDLSALIATIVLLLASFATARRLNLRKIGDTLANGALLLARVGTAGALVGIIMSGFSLTGLTALLPSAMSDLAGGNVFILLVLGAVASIVLGMGAPPLLVYVLLAATVAPALIRLGIDPLAAHMFIFYYGMLAMITPPVAISVLIAAKIANANFWQACFHAVRMGLVAFIVPFFFVFRPALLFQGSASEIVLTMFTSLIGVTALGCGLARYIIVRPAALWEVALLLPGGLLLMFPGITTDAIGIACIAPVLANGFVQARKQIMQSNADAEHVGRT